MSNKVSWPEFDMRGAAMDRIEVFVAAAFAFAVTLLVISTEDVPQNFDDFLIAIKTIPAFAASFAIIVWIWHTHATWCRRYGLEDSKTVLLSSVLVFLILVYIYPLKIILQGFFAEITNGFLPVNMEFNAYWQVRLIFIFYASGFWLVTINFISLYRHALNRKETLNLSVYEITDTKFDIQNWCGASAVAFLSLVSAVFLPDGYLGFSGYANFLLFPVLSGIGYYHANQRRKMLVSGC